MFVRLETRAGKSYAKLVQGFRDRHGRVRQRVFVLDPDPAKLRALAWRLLNVARRLEQQATPPAPQPAAGANVPGEPTVFVSLYPGLRLMGGPRGTVCFNAGRYTAWHRDEIEWLLRHPDFGVRFFLER